MKTFLLAAALLCYALDSPALQVKDAFSISGQLLDENQQPVSFATLALLSIVDSSLIKGELSNESGLFLFENIPAGKYLLLVSFLGYANFMKELQVESIVDLGAISLVKQSTTLNEVVVKAAVPLIQHEHDKIVVNVESSSILSGGSAFDALQKTPGIVIDQDGNISLRGKQNVLVMIDDKPTYLSTEQLASQLKAMPAETVSKLEVITNPSARYDAEGNAGIINIVTKKNKAPGFNAGLNAGLSYGKLWSPKAGLNMNYRVNQLNLFGSYQYSDNAQVQNIDIERNFDDNGNTSVVYEQSNLEHHSGGHRYKAGMDYFINEKHTLGFVANGFFDDYTTKNNTVAEIGNGDGSREPSSYTYGDLGSYLNNYSINLNYDVKLDTLGTVLSADADYSRFAGKGDDDYITTYYDEDGNITGSPLNYNSQSPGDIYIRSAKVDYSHPFANQLNLEAGVKASAVRNDNEAIFLIEQNGEWITDSTKTNAFVYDENVYAGYLQLSRAFGKTNVQAGLRGEYTAADGNSETVNESFSRRYFQLFPSATLSNQLSPHHHVSLSYSRRIDRPDYEQLNPFLFFLDPYLYEQGNPNLNPQLTNSIEFNYVFKETYTLSLNYSSTADQIEELFYQIDSTKTIILQPDNFGNNTTYSATAFAPLQPASWWSVTPVVTAFYQDLSTDYGGETYQANQFGYNLNLQNDFMLPKGFSVELSAWYQSPLLWSIGSINGFGDVSLGVKKSIHEGKGTLKLSFTDLFDTDDISGGIRFSNINGSFVQENDNRRLHLSFNYRFGSGPGRERQRQNSIEEEQNRVKTGG